MVDVSQPRFNVLLLEDNAISQVVFLGHLEQLGVRSTKVVTTIAEARALSAEAFKGDFDLVVFDIMLPDGESDELAREWKQQIDCPLIAYTARSAPKEVIRLEQAGFDLILTKPLTLEKFKSKMERVLN